MINILIGLQLLQYVPRRMLTSTGIITYFLDLLLDSLHALLLTVGVPVNCIVLGQLIEEDILDMIFSDWTLELSLHLGDDEGCLIMEHLWLDYLEDLADIVGFE